MLNSFRPIDRALLTTVSKLQIENGLVRISAGLVGILLNLWLRCVQEAMSYKFPTGPRFTKELNGSPGDRGSGF